MSITTQNAIILPEIPKDLPPAIVGKFNMTLTENKFQLLANEAAKLVHNEDNLETIKEFLDKTKKLDKAIEKTHKDGKEEALKIGQNWDNAKKSFLTQTAAIVAIPRSKYDQLCKDISARAEEQRKENIRIETIKTGIENNAISYANKIANANTSIELTEIERNINLEKTRKEKYAEFYDSAVVRYNELNSLLASQKLTVKEAEELERQKQLAIEQNDEQAQLDIAEKQEQVQNKIEEQKEIVQVAAIEQSMNQAPITPTQTIFPTVKAKRTSWKWKVSDINVTAKKMPDWTKITPIEEAIDTYLKTKKAEGSLVEDFEFAGISFYKEITY